MGKGVGILGTISGKVGSTVFYRLTNSNNGEKQGYREYRATTRNPQTDQQLDQRVKMAVVTNEYRALRDVIRRGMQSHAYGDASRRAWLKLALGADFVGPYLEKGDKSPLPMPNVPISVGGLPEIVIESVDHDGNANTSLLWGVNYSSTVGSLSALLLSSNSWLQEGDQLTFVSVIPVPGSGVTVDQQQFYYHVASLVLDRSSSQPTSNLALTFGPDTSDNFMVFADENGSQVAAAIILSREGPTGEHLRSTATFGFSDSMSAFYSSLNPAQARRSYKKGVTAEADWPVEQESGVGTTPVDALLLSGLEVPVSQLAVVDGYLKASGYFLKITNTTNPKYNRYITGYASSSNTAPTGATNDNTISVDTASTTALQTTFTQWLLDNGVNAQWLYTAST